MKSLLLIPVLFSALLTSAAFAGERTAICKAPYQHDGFMEELRLVLEKKQDGSRVLWMDTPTPYGIRPYSYDVKVMNCSANTLNVEAQASGTAQQVVFKSEDQLGTLTYLDTRGAPQSGISVTCDLAEIAKACQ